MQLMPPRAPALARLRTDRSGVAMLEFAFTAPIVLALGLYGVEIGNQALVSMKLSQIALNLADNASRMGSLDNNNIESMREGDVNDMFQAARIQGDGINLANRGRIILSSLENVQQNWDSAPVQRIHWQRCMGKMSGSGYDSSYGSALPVTTAGTTNTPEDQGTATTTGMGEPGAKVIAPPNSGLMFVEINYQYQPLVSSWLARPYRMHYVASMIVRNNRDFRQIYNPVNYATRSTCDRYTI